MKMVELIKIGVKGGEFDLSALYRSQMSVENLTLVLLDLKSQYQQSLQKLNIFSLNSLQEPLCSDLLGNIGSFEEETFQNSSYFQAVDMQVKKQTALKNYRNSPIKQVTVGLAYNDEMDITRTALSLQVPLTWGANKRNSVEVAKERELAALSQKSYLQKELEVILQAYKIKQHNNAMKLQYINDKLILKAYKTVELMQERFKVGEANYLEYISSQEALFNYVLQTIKIRKDALVEQAKLYSKLGISPLKEQK
ncbi:MAG: TolC family protein [Sulfurimonas sp.]|nr:TolC family protein [Sulfurimonas sp.]